MRAIGYFGVPGGYGGIVHVVEDGKPVCGAFASDRRRSSSGARQPENSTTSNAGVARLGCAATTHYLLRAKVTAEIWIDMDRLFEADLGWELSEDKKEDATYLVEQAVDALSGIVGLRVKTTKARSVPRGAYNETE